MVLFLGSKNESGMREPYEEDEQQQSAVVVSQ